MQNILQLLPPSEHSMVLQLNTPQMCKKDSELVTLNNTIY